MYIPVWAAVAGVIGTIAAAFIAGSFALKNNNRNADVTQTANLLKGYQEMTGSLVGNTNKYQEILEKYAASVTKEAKTAASLETITGELHDLKEKFTHLQESFDELKEQYLSEKERAERVPGLERQVEELKARLEHKDETIKNLNVENDALGMGQAQLEGALAQATSPPGTVVIKQTIHDQERE